MINWPAPPSGLSNEANWFRKLLSACRQTEILPGVGYRVKETSNGRTLEIIQKNVQGMAVWFTGEYDPNRNYVCQQCCIVSAGSNAGAFVCIKASTGNNPWAGNGFFVQLPQGQLGTWM
jgi:hypothetical protein